MSFHRQYAQAGADYRRVVETVNRQQIEDGLKAFGEAVRQALTDTAANAQAIDSPRAT